MFSSQGARHGGSEKRSLQPSSWMHEASLLRAAGQQTCSKMFCSQGAWHGGCQAQALRPSSWLHESAQLRAVGQQNKHQVFHPQGARHGVYEAQASSNSVIIIISLNPTSINRVQICAANKTANKTQYPVLYCTGNLIRPFRCYLYYCPTGRPHGAYYNTSMIHVAPRCR